jgi:hypothetical protein
VSALARQGLIARRRGPAALVAAVLAAAAAVVLIIWLRAPQPMTTTPDGPRFVLMLYAGESRTRDAPDRHQEYADWARGIARHGTTISGEELADGGDELGPASTSQADARLDEPRGYFVVSAPDVDAARRIAATCPHLRYGGRIVVRRIVS